MRAPLSPRYEAVAFLIWRFASKRGWRVTQAQIAAGIGEDVDTVCKVAGMKGWQGRTLGGDREYRRELARTMIAQRNRARKRASMRGPH